MSERVPGHVPMREYRAMAQKVEELQAKLDYARFLLGEHRDDDIAIAKAAARLRCGGVSICPGYLRFAMRLARAYPHPVVIETSDRLSKVVVHRLRAWIVESGADARLIRTIVGVGYQLSGPGREWLKQHLPEAFTPGSRRVAQVGDAESEAAAA